MQPERKVLRIAVLDEIYLDLIIFAQNICYNYQFWLIFDWLQLLIGFLKIQQCQ